MMELTNEQIKYMKKFVRHQDEYECIVLISHIIKTLKKTKTTDEIDKIIVHLHHPDPREKVRNLREYIDTLK